MIVGGLHVAVLDDVRMLDSGAWEEICLTTTEGAAMVGCFPTRLSTTDNYRAVLKKKGCISSDGRPTADTPPTRGLDPFTATPLHQQRRSGTTSQAVDMPPPRLAVSPSALMAASSPLLDMMSRAEAKKTTWWTTQHESDVLSDAKRRDGAAESMMTLPTIHYDIGVYVGTNSVVLFDSAGSHVASFPFAALLAVGWRCRRNGVNISGGGAETHMRFDREFAPSHHLSVETTRPGERGFSSPASPVSAAPRNAAPDYAELDLVCCKPHDWGDLSHCPAVDTAAVVCGVGLAGVERLVEVKARLVARWHDYLDNGGAARSSLFQNRPAASSTLVHPSRDAVVYSAYTHSATTATRSASRAPLLSDPSIASPHRSDPAESMSLKQTTRHLMMTAGPLSIASPHSSLRQHYHPSRGDAAMPLGTAMDVDVRVIGQPEPLPTTTDGPSSPKNCASALSVLRAASRKSSHQSGASAVGSPPPRAAVRTISDDQPAHVWGAIRSMDNVEVPQMPKARQDPVTGGSAAVAVKPLPFEYPLTCVVCGETFDLRRRAEHLAVCNA